MSAEYSSTATCQNASDGRANINTPYDKTKALLFFPAAGGGYYASLSSAGTFGYYWASTLYTATGAYNLHFGSDSVNPEAHYHRYVGRPVRPVSD